MKYGDIQKKMMLACLFLYAAAGSFGVSSEKSIKVLEGKDGVFAVMETTRGDIVFELYYKQTPLTVTNFVGLAEGTLDAAKGKPFYDGLTFHRVISKINGDGQDFMIQGGDPQGTGRGGPGYNFTDEIDENFTFDSPGILAMANAGPNTNGSQFFVTHVPAPWLNGKHTIFGHVISGQDVVNKTRQGDKIVKVTIFRQGNGAQKFTANQSDFDRLSAIAKKAADDKNAKVYAEQIKEVEKKFADFKKTSGGIYYKITKEGKGNKTGAGKNVATEYKGYLVSGKVFDTSAGRGPLSFRTAGGQMIPGFDIMVQDMRLGEKRTVVLPPGLAYGENGIPGVIPSRAYLVFDIELVKN